MCDALCSTMSFSGTKFLYLFSLRCFFLIINFDDINADFMTTTRTIVELETIHFNAFSKMENLEVEVLRVVKTKVVDPFGFI